MLQYGPIACFTPVIKSQHKLGGYSSAKIVSWKMEKHRGFGDPNSSLYWKINSSGRRYRLCKIPQHADLELTVTMHEMTQD